MKYFDILSTLHSNNARYGDRVEITTVLNDSIIDNYMNCDDSAVYFVSGNSIPIKNVVSIRVLK